MRNGMFVGGRARLLPAAMMLATTILAGMAAPALAQDALSAQPQPQQPGAAGGAAPDRADTGVEEIIVTARKRDETLLQVPVAVSAVSASDLNRYAATDLGKIGQLVPQVILAKSGGGGAGASFTIRGIGSSALDAGIDQTVALNLDGLQISRGRLVTQSFFDLQQVEVLKGPQALFFGKNSPGGVVSVHTAGATRDFEGYARAGYEFKADERFVEGAVSGPITDTLGFRLAGRGSKMAGYIRNVAGPLGIPSDPANPSPGAAHGRDPGTREILGRATIEWRPGSDFSAVFKLFGSRLRDHGETSGTELKCQGNPQTLDLLSGVFVQDPYGDCKLNGRRSLGALNPVLAAGYPESNGGVPITRYSAVLSSLTLDYKVGPVALTSVTGYWRYKNDSFDNFAFDATPTVFGANLDKSHAFTQELRANSSFDGPIDFAAGLYFEDGGRDTRGNGFIANVGADARNGQYNNWSLLSFNKTRAYSAFGQLIWNITPQIELAGGVRYTHERKRVRLGNSFVNQNLVAFGLVATEGQFTSGRFSDDDWSPEATLSYHPTSNTTLYGAYKTGYKSGGFSNPSILSFGQTAADLGFRSESAEGGELGAKGSFMGGRLALNAALYRYKFNGLQLTSFNPSPPSFTIRNAASARTTGAEVDGSYQITRDFQLRAAAGYNRAKYLSFPAAPCYPGQTLAQGCTAANTQDLSGTALVRAPKWNVTGGFSYDTLITTAVKLGVSGDANYTSGYWLQENQNPVAWQQGFARLNASLRLHAENDAWELALIGRNLTNKYYGVAGSDKPFGTPDEIWISIGRPREVLLQGTVRFGNR
ncbi:TonB-dependent receptor [Sphingomonas profundi]|uniref:TonB-dependent receptor n=1 Tax=Alterirhizorhabdus profundi TaxID=2681549 RepID=UPI0012E903E1|nr:TonB-dependent receptor [Sphingomonas profundi]